MNELEENGTAHRPEIEVIAAVMRDQPEQRRSIEEMAQSIGVSLPHFSRAFRAAMGVSPRQYQLRVRLDRARHLLAESNLSIGQIADSLGYADLFFFSKQFARHTAMSPSAYRRTVNGRLPASRDTPVDSSTVF
jgi:transcriptional regulator GlxA family with amidase domain